MKFLKAKFCVMVAALTFAWPQVLLAEDELDVHPLKVGDRPLGSTVAAFAQGNWREKQASACPILLQRNDPKIAIYVRHLDVSALALAQAIEQVIADNPALKWSFMMIDNSHSPERILESRLRFAREAADNYHIANLSFGLFSTVEASARGNQSRGRKQLTVLANSDIVVTLVVPLAKDSETKSSTPTIVYMKSLRSSEVSSETIREIVADITQSFNEHSQRMIKP